MEFQSNGLSKLESDLTYKDSFLQHLFNEIHSKYVKNPVNLLKLYFKFHRDFGSVETKFLRQ